MIDTPDCSCITPTRSERSALELPWKNLKRVITRDQSLDVLSESGSAKRDWNVNFLLNRLRRKLLDDGREPRFLATHDGEGHVWIADTPGMVHALAEANVVIGPVLGPRLVTEPDDATEFALAFARTLVEAYGPDTNAVYAPDCPPLERVGPTPAIRGTPTATLRRTPSHSPGSNTVSP